MQDKEHVRIAYSVAEIARMVGLSRSTLYTEMGSGRLGYIKVGARRLITESAVDAYLHKLSDDSEQVL